MRYIILMSHGHLASGMKSTVEMIAGQHDNLLAYDAYVDGHHDVKTFFDEFIKKHGEDEMIVITDALGGSVNNDMLNYNHMPNVYVASGMNVAFVLNIILKEEENIPVLIQASIEESKKMISYFEKVENDEDEDF